MLDRSVLSDLSAAFAERLFHTYPDWEQFAKNLFEGSFEVEIQQSGIDRPLLTDTENDEITVGWFYWHSHFGPFLGISDEDAIDQAMEEIRLTLAEELAVVVLYKDGQPVWSHCVHPTEPVSREPGVAAHIYSWRGSHDRVVEG